MVRKKKNVNVEDVEKLLEAIGEINRHPFEDIVWMKNGQPLPVQQEVLDQFRFTGLSNKDFVALEYWKEQNVRD